MDISVEVGEELRKTNLSRNRFAYLAQLLIISLSIWYQTRFEGTGWIFTLSFAVFGCLLRFIATEIVREREVSNIFLWAGFLNLGIAWSHHFATNFIPASSVGMETIFLLFAMAGTISVLLTTLVADPVSYFVFLAPISATVLGIYGIEGLRENLFFFLCILMMMVLTSVSFVHQHRQLRLSIRSRLETNRERQRLKRVLDGIPGFVGLTDSSGTYIDGNQNILEIFPNLIGTRIGELTPTSSYGKFVNQFLHSKRETEAQETEAVMNGVHHTLMTTCGRTEDGGVIIINIPINELVKARKELREKEAVAQYSSKLASLGQMAAGVAHEVNNPLAIIQGSASIIGSLVLEENVDRKNLKLFSDRIIATTDRIAQIVRSLRTLSRGGEKDPFSPLSLKKVIASCLDISNHNLKQSDVRLIIPEDKKDLTIMGREVQLGQVLLNLLSNAIDAVKDLPERWVSVDYGHVDGHVWIEVVDSGKGIPQDVTDKMMEPFFTTKSKDEGTGLGLSISSKIIEEHGGRLSYEKDRTNTTFKVSFPSPKI